MARDDTYDLMPHQQIKELQKEVERLKRLPFGKGKTGKDLVSSIDALNSSVNKLIDVFETATKELVKQEEPPKPIHKKEGKPGKEKEHPVYGKIEKLIDQNKTIAEALLSIADMIKGERQPEQKPEQKQTGQTPGQKQPSASSGHLSKLRPRPIRPRFEQLQPRQQYVPPMQTPEQPQSAPQPKPQQQSQGPTGAPISPNKMAQTGLKPPMPEPMPPLPQVPSINKGEQQSQEQSGGEKQKPKKKGLFHFK